jgi:hypothetical protein
MTFDLALAAAVLSAHGKSEWEWLEKSVLFVSATELVALR